MEQELQVIQPTPETASQVPASTISVIAAQVGRTRIVVAVLTHGDRLELRLQEMEPSLYDFGRTLRDTLEQQIELNECLVKLQAKEMAVEEALEQSDDLVVAQGLRPELHRAMADSLGKAWMLFFDMLTARAHILDIAFSFHQQYDWCMEYMDTAVQNLEKAKHDPEARSLTDISKIQKENLESIKDTLTYSQELITFMEEFIVQYNAVSYGLACDLYPATNQINQMLEKLSDKRRRLKALLHEMKSLSRMPDADGSMLIMEFEDIVTIYENAKARAGRIMSRAVTPEKGPVVKQELQNILDICQNLIERCALLSQQSHTALVGHPELSQRIATLFQNLSTSRQLWEQQLFTVDMCVDTFQSLQRGRHELKTIVTDLDRSLNSWNVRDSDIGMDERIEMAVQDILGLTSTPLHQSNFLAENPVGVDITELLEEVNRFQDECQEALDGLLSVQPMEVQDETGFHGLFSTCRLLRSWVARRMHDLREDNKIETQLYAVDTFLCKHDLFVQEIGEHQEMLDTMVEAMQDVRETSPEREQVGALSVEVGILMEEWNELIAAVNIRLLIGGQLRNVLLTLEQIREIPRTELPLQSEGLPELRKACHDLFVSVSDIPEDILQTANLREAVRLTCEELGWDVNELRTIPMEVDEHDADVEMMPQKTDEEFAAVMSRSVVDFVSRLEQMNDSLTNKLTAAGPTDVYNSLKNTEQSQFIHRLSSSLDKMLSTFLRIEAVGAGLLPPDARPLERITEEPVTSGTNGSPPSSEAGITQEKPVNLARVLNVLADFNWQSQEVHRKVNLIRKELRKFEPPKVAEPETFSETFVLVSGELQKFKSLFQAFIEDHSDRLFDSLPNVLSSGFTRAPSQGLYEAVPSESGDDDSIGAVKPEFLNVFHDITVRQGQLAVIECQVRGAPPPTISWLINDLPPNPSKHQVLVHNAQNVLIVRITGQEDAGKIVCTASNDVGVATWTCHVHVESFAEIIEEEDSEETLTEAIVEAKTAPGFAEAFAKEMEMERIAGVKSPPIIGRCTIISRGEETGSAHPGEEASLIPPSFTQKLLSKVIREGESVLFEARVAGSPLPHITWFRNNQILSSGSDRCQIIHTGDLCQLVISSVNRLDAGAVKITAVNAGGEAICIADLLVAPASPRISQGALQRDYRQVTHTEEITATTSSMALRQHSPSPTHQPLMRAPPFFTRTLHPTTVTEHDSIILECSVQAHPLPVIRWLHNGAELTDADSSRMQMTFSQNGTCTLIIRDAQISDAGQYVCHASNAVGKRQTTTFVVVEATSDLSHAAAVAERQVVTVPAYPTKHVSLAMPKSGMKPRFLNQLRTAQLVVGSTAYFECKVSGVPPPTVVWSHNGQPVYTSARRTVGVNSSNGVHSLQIQGVQEEDEGEYTCTAFNEFGEDSTSAFLLSAEKFSEWLQQERKRRPSVPRGLSPSPQQSPVPEYRTKRLRTQRPASSERGVSEEMEIDVMEERSLRALPPRPFRPQSAPPTSRKPQRVPTNEFGQLDYSLTGLDESWQEGLESPQFDYSMGFATPEPTVEAFSEQASPHPPRFTQSLASVRCAEGDQVQLRAKVSGHPKPRITWLKNGTRLQSPSARLQLLYDGEFVIMRIRMAMQEDTGHYTIVAENTAGQQTCSASLTVDPSFRRQQGKSSSQPNILSSPSHRISSPVRAYTPSRELESSQGSLGPQFLHCPPDKIIKEGQLVRFDCRVSGRPYPEVLWYRNGQPIYDDFTHKIIVNESGEHSLMITHASLDDTGQYHLIVEEADKLIAPTFVQRFYNMTAQEETTVQFFARAVGVPMPIISWLKGATELQPSDRIHIETKQGASTLTIHNVMMEDADWYLCTARNSAGVASAKAKLTVEPPLKNVDCDEGHRAHFECLVNLVADPDLAIEWFKDGVPLKLDDRIRVEYLNGRVTLRITNAQPTDEGVWVIKVTNRFGESRSATSIHISSTDQRPKGPPSPPTFVIHPQTDTLVEHENNTIFIEFRITPHDAMVEFLKDGQVVRDSSHIKTVTSGGYGILEINVAGREDTGAYTCRATTSLGTVDTTFNVDVKALEPVHRATIPSVQIAPLDARVDEGTPARFYCTVGGAPRPRVSWRINGQFVTSGDRYRITTDNFTSSLEILHTRQYDTGEITVIAENSEGTSTARARLTVAPHKEPPPPPRSVPSSPTSQRRAPPAPQPPPISPPTRRRPSTSVHDHQPVFTQRLQPFRTPSGQPATFFCEFQSTTETRVEWYREQTLIEASTDFHIETTERSSRLVIPQAFVEDSGNFTVKIINEFGETESTATLIIEEPRTPSAIGRPIAPSFVDTLRDTRVKGGQLARFEAKIHGTEPITVTWLRNGQPLHDSDRTNIFRIGDQCRLLIRDAIPEDTGSYQCVVSNETGEARSEAFLTVEGISAFTVPQEPIPVKQENKPPKVIKPPSDTTAFEGEAVTMRCTIEGNPKPEMRWYKGPHLVRNSKYYRTFVTDNVCTLVIREALHADEGEYRCVGKNPFGQAEDSAYIRILDVPSEAVQLVGEKLGERRVAIGEDLPFAGPEIDVPLPPTVEAYRGEEIKLSCSVKHVLPHPSFAWYKGDQMIHPAGDFTVFGDKWTYSLTIKEAYPDDASQYTCVIWNEFGLVKSTTSITVTEPPPPPPKAPSPEEPEYTFVEETYAVEETSSLMQETIRRFRKNLPTFTQALPERMNVVEGKQYELHAQTVSDLPTTYDWQVDGREIRHSPDYQIQVGPEGSTLTVTSASRLDSGHYVVRARTDQGEQVSRVDVNVKTRTAAADTQQAIKPPSPVPTFEVYDTTYEEERSENIMKESVRRIRPVVPRFTKALASSMTVYEGERVEMEVEVRSKEPVAFEWERDGVAITQSTDRLYVVSGEKISVLNITITTMEDQGRYTCYAISDAGEKSTTTKLHVIRKSRCDCCVIFWWIVFLVGLVLLYGCF
ncbi:titin-like [Paramacrobiotus metropolitanus]|uniref:titin-like n=1 Tax=Paramacrobiotus metropolitanus TaxID=2943436 RepID=UPI002446339B|nr:titin-like [Paramacrobiotus metropolitanus]